jgi:hypothetical protein
MNAVSADIIEFTSNKNFEKFKQETEHLNKLETFPHLRARSERIGYEIYKVVFLGFMVRAIN